jgi:tetratricopeptide (TPR) repeat protein
VKLGDLAKASTALGLLHKANAPGQDAGLREQTAVLIQEMQALIAMANGRQADAFAAMDRATALQAQMPKPIGRPYPVKGADELYGEILLQAGRAKDAVVWFERALARTPNRSRAVLGLARAAAKAGQIAKSRRAFQQFLTNWRFADAGLPELHEAKAALSRPQAPGNRPQAPGPPGISQNDGTFCALRLGAWCLKPAAWPPPIVRPTARLP